MAQQTHIADIDEIISFWYAPQVKPLWFKSTPEFDQQLRDKFLDTLEAAQRGQLDAWRESAYGALALAILFDQFPLNMFRGNARGFATEQHARDVANHAIENKLDQQLNPQEKIFLYMPFMHSEDLADQDKSVELYAAAGLEDNLRFAKHHREIIRRFGRFPHRNDVLGRSSTEEEQVYLNSKEAFHG